MYWRYKVLGLTRDHHNHFPPRIMSSSTLYYFFSRGLLWEFLLFRLGVSRTLVWHWGNTGTSVPFGKASVTALGAIKWVPISQFSARTHL